MISIEKITNRWYFISLVIILKSKKVIKNTPMLSNTVIGTNTRNTNNIYLYLK